MDVRRYRPSRGRFAFVVAALLVVAGTVQLGGSAGAAAASVPTGGYTVSGTLSNGAGTAIANMPVSIYATDVLLGGPGPTYTLPVVGTSTTDASGRWTITVPSPLPGSLQAMADANGGVLNVQAISVGTAPDGTMMTAMQSFGLTSTTTTQPSGLQQLVAKQDAQPNSAIFYPVAQNADTKFDDGATIDQSNNTSYLSDSSTDYTSGDTADSQPGSSAAAMQTLNGNSYANVVPAAPQNRCPYIAVKTLKRETHLNTPVSEAHGYWDATGSVRLGTSASQSLGVGVSYDNAVWSLDGTTSMGHSWGSSMSQGEPGSFYANQVDVPIDWVKNHYYYKYCDGTTRDIAWVWQSLGYDPGPNQLAISLGKSVISNDGYNQYIDSNKNYRLNYGVNSKFDIETGTSLTYSFTAGVFPLRLTAETAYDKTRTQRIDFGNGTERNHEVWSNNRRPDQGAKVFYSW